MTAKSNDQGRAYEYAWMNVLFDNLNEIRNTEIVDNSSLHTNIRAWNTLKSDKKEIFITSANSAIKTLMELEPRMEENDNDLLLLEFQQDGNGCNGDVRDIVIKRNSLDWEVGLSIKHNHAAVKHSRISKYLDFGKMWYELPCSKEYWKEVLPVFKQLEIEKENKTKWKDIEDKHELVYIPLLKAFSDEIKRAYVLNPEIISKMLRYLIGVKDYHKIICYDSKKMTMIESFNINNSLGKPSKTKQSILKLIKVKLPTELVDIRFKSNSTTTIEMYLNNGWQLSFRLHNASSTVDTSLKFDVQFIGMPRGIQIYNCYWH